MRRVNTPPRIPGSRLQPVGHVPAARLGRHWLYSAEMLPTGKKNKSRKSFHGHGGCVQTDGFMVYFKVSKLKNTCCVISIGRQLGTHLTNTRAQRVKTRIVMFLEQKREFSFSFFSFMSQEKYIVPQNQLQKFMRWKGFIAYCHRHLLFRVAWYTWNAKLTITADLITALCIMRHCTTQSEESVKLYARVPYILDGCSSIIIFATQRRKRQSLGMEWKVIKWWWCDDADIAIGMDHSFLKKWEKRLTYTKKYINLENVPLLR